MCFIVDAFSRMIVGWRVAGHMRTSMVLDAMEMARWSRGARLEGLRCHSDAGSQFTSLRWGERLAEIGAVPSIGCVGDSFDNALAETVNGYYKAELIRGPDPSGPWKTIDDVEPPPSDGCTGTTPAGCTATSATSRPPSTSRRSTLPTGPTTPGRNPTVRASIRPSAVHSARALLRDGGAGRASDSGGGTGSVPPLAEAFVSAWRGRAPPEGPALEGLRPAAEVLVPTWAEPESSGGHRRRW